MKSLKVIVLVLFMGVLGCSHAPKSDGPIVQYKAVSPKVHKAGIGRADAKAETYCVHKITTAEAETCKHKVGEVFCKSCEKGICSESEKFHLLGDCNYTSNVVEGSTCAASHKDCVFYAAPLVTVKDRK